MHACRAGEFVTKNSGLVSLSVSNKIGIFGTSLKMKPTHLVKSLLQPSANIVRGVSSSSSFPFHLRCHLGRWHSLPFLSLFFLHLSLSQVSHNLMLRHFVIPGGERSFPRDRKERPPLFLSSVDAVISTPASCGIIHGCSEEKHGR